MTGYFLLIFYNDKITIILGDIGGKKNRILTSRHCYLALAFILQQHINKHRISQRKFSSQVIEDDVMQ